MTVTHETRSIHSLMDFPALLRLVHHLFGPHGYRALRAVWRRIRLRLPTSLLARPVVGVPGLVHVEDGMLTGPSIAEAEEYARVGRQPLGLIDEGLHCTGRTWADVETLLDYGAGYGRVLRWFRAEHPNVRATAVDVNPQAAQFCKEAFHAESEVVDPRPQLLVLPSAHFDVIWVGSVFTHLSEADGGTLLTVLAGSLRFGGLILFSTHGELIEARLQEYGPETREAVPEIRDGLRDGRIVYVDSQGHSYPQTFHSRKAVADWAHRAASELKLVTVKHRGWADHHDVWCFERPTGES